MALQRRPHLLCCCRYCLTGLMSGGRPTCECQERVAGKHW
jgi:hypothetical protein